MRAVISALMLLVAGITANADSPKPHVVMLIAEREYETDQTLPKFTKKHLGKDYRTTMVFADPDDRNRLVGIEAVKEADVLLVSVRRRTLPKPQLDIVRSYVAAGKPVIGIRTANHAFCQRNKPAPQGRAEWPEWDKEVFGGNYTNHYGNSLKATVTFRSDSRSAQLLRGIDTRSFVAGGSLYRVSPLDKSADVCLLGRVEGNPAEPIAWTFRRKKDGGKSFYTSLGHVDDFAGDVLPPLLVNAISWATQ